MKIDHYINNRIAVAWMLLLSLFLLPACSNEEDGPVVEPEQLYTVTLSLNPSTRGATTKASDPYWDVDDDVTLEKYERYIDNCIVAIFQNGSWVKSLSYNINNVTSDIEIDNENAIHNNNNYSTAVGEASVELPAGTYIFFAFANLTSLDIDGSNAGSTLIGELISGKKMDNSAVTLDYVKSKVVNLGEKIDRFNPNPDDNSVTYIPMSSYGEVEEINGNSEMDITLYRMIGKVSISINNQTAGELELNGFSMGKFLYSDIYLIPYGATSVLIGSTTSGVTLDQLTQVDQQNTYNPRIPENAKRETKSHVIQFEKSVTIPKNETNEPYVYTFYEFETDVNAQSPSGSMWLSVDITGRDKSQQPLEDFSFMRRNDWLNIPLMIAETNLKISIQGLRMPVGGIPETIEYESQTPFVPAMECEINHTGVIQFTFDFSMANFKNVILLDKQAQYEGEEKYTKAIVSTNSDQLLCDASTQNVLQEGAELDIDIDGASGTIQVSTQELAFEGKAIIELTLYVSYERNDGVTGTMTIPYTITLTNGKPAKEGGN